MAAEAVQATLKRTWNILNELTVPAALMGGLALAQWGRVRVTQDVDVLIGLDNVRESAVLARLAARGYRSKGRARIVRLPDAEFIQLLYEPPDSFIDIQIDLLLAISPFHKQALARRVALPPDALGCEAFVVSCEDLIILKLLAGRILDRVDVADLLTINRESLDFAYVSGWVRQLTLERALREAWTDAFPTEPPPV